MRDDSLSFITPPELTDHTACEILDFLYEIVNAFEVHYADQLRRETVSEPCAMRDLFAEFDDEIP